MKKLAHTLRLTAMNRTYFEPKPLHQEDHLNLLNKHDLSSMDDDTDLEADDIELGHRINHEIDASHQSLIDRTELPIDLDTTNSCHEWIKATAWRIKQSVQFFLVYLVLIVLNAFVLIWVKLTSHILAQNMNINMNIINITKQRNYQTVQIVKYVSF